MIRGFYTAGTGLITHQNHLNMLSNNLANANTVGFKPVGASFADLLYQNINRETAENPAMAGHGVKIVKSDINMQVGMLEATQRQLDFALPTEGDFFAVQNAYEEISYTRAGNFALSNEDDTYFLVNAAGERVLDTDGNEIEIEFDSAGEMQFDPATIGVFRFANPFGLQLVGGSRFVPTEQSGEAEQVEEPVIKSGFLEGSGVRMSDEMVKVIEASKAFAFSSRMVQTADEVEQLVNTLR